MKAALLALIAAQLMARAAAAQLIAPEVVVNGEPGSEFIYSVRYYEDGKPQSTTVSRGKIPAADEAEVRLPLEGDCDGIRMSIAVAGFSGWKASLKDGIEDGTTATQNSPGVMALEIGAVPERDPLPDLNAYPDAAGQATIGQFMRSLANADSRALVSDLPLANIDWPVLDAYFTRLHQELGRIQYPAGDQVFGDWLTWEGSLGAQVYSGMVRFERGNSHFRLMTIDGKLVDVEPSAPLMPADWLVKPPDCELYIGLSNSLLRSLFAGDAAGSQLLFSRRYDDEVTVEKVAEWCNQLRESYGTEVTRGRFANVDFTDGSNGSKHLNVRTLLKLNSGKQCLGTVRFAIDASKDTVSRAHLQSFHVAETFPSAEPAKAELLMRLLRELHSSTEPNVAAAWYAAFSEEVQRLQSLEELTAFLAALNEGGVQPMGGFSLDLWNHSGGEVSTTSGSLLCSMGQEVRFKVHWLGDRVYGVSVNSMCLAQSTLGLRQPVDGMQLDEQPEVRAAGFWRALLAADAAKAHQYLGPLFAQRVSLEQLQQMVASDEGVDAPAPSVTNITLDSLRLVEDDDRTAPIAIGVHQVAEFSDGSYLPLYSEFARVGDNAWELRKFSSDVVADFPVDGSTQLTAFAQPFLEQAPDKLLQLFAPAVRERSDPRLTAAFMKSTAALLGEPMKLSKQAGFTRQIADGMQVLVLEGYLSGPERYVPFSAVFEQERLLRFKFEHPSIAGFAVNMEETAPVDEFLVDFLRRWHDPSRLGEDGQRLVADLSEDLQTPAALAKLGELQREFQLDYGPWLDAKIIDRRSSPGHPADIEVDVALAFERGEKLLQLTLVANALQLRVAEIEVLEQKKAE